MYSEESRKAHQFRRQRGRGLAERGKGEMSGKGERLTIKLSAENRNARAAAPVDGEKGENDTAGRREK